MAPGVTRVRNSTKANIGFLKNYNPERMSYYVNDKGKLPSP